MSVWVPDWKGILSSVLFFFLTSCASQDDQFQKKMEGILSWSASAEMILDARLGGLVPKGFADLAVERCQKEISNLSSQLPQASTSRKARTAILQLDRLIAAAHDEIDHGGFEQGRQHLAELHQREVELRNAHGVDG